MLTKGKGIIWGVWESYLYVLRRKLPKLIYDEMWMA